MGLIITPPPLLAFPGTLVIASGKTLTANNTLTFTGTDSSSVAFGTGGTVLYSGGAVTNIATTSPISGGTITSTGTISLLVNTDFLFTASQSVTKTINATSADGLVLTNTTAAAAGAQQWSPRLHLTGKGWKTDATAASQTTDWIVENQPVQGTTNPTSNLVFSSQINGAGYVERFAISSSGVMGSTSVPSDGKFQTDGYGLNVSTNGTIRVALGDSYIGLHSSARLSWAASGGATSAQDLYLYRAAAATLQMGFDVNGAPVTQTLKAHNGTTGTDVAGAPLIVSGGKGTGAGTISYVAIQSSTLGSTGTTAQTLAERARFDSAGVTMADAMNLVFNTTTGTKIGTATGQKIGFWNATPVVQQVLATGTLKVVDDVIALLQTLGLCKQS